MSKQEKNETPVYDPKFPDRFAREVREWRTAKRTTTVPVVEVMPDGTPTIMASEEPK